jgi:hypothetical protein
VRRDHDGRAEVSDGEKRVRRMKMPVHIEENDVGPVLRPDRGEAGVLTRYLEVRRRQACGTASQNDAISPDLIRESFARSAPAGSALRDSVGAFGAFGRGDAIAMSTLGSHNQDRRSTLLDGEVLTAVAGEDCLPAMIDFAFLMETATWPEKIEELDACFPETSSLLRRLSRWLRDFI